MKRSHIVALYFLTLSIPALLGLNAWQSCRYADLERETVRLESAQEEWINSNRRLIAGIALLSSSERIEYIARNELGLTKKQPAEVLQILIKRRAGVDG
jgi:cell division protein FtsL